MPVVDVGALAVRLDRLVHEQRITAQQLQEVLRHVSTRYICWTMRTDGVPDSVAFSHRDKIMQSKHRSFTSGISLWKSGEGNLTLNSELTGSRGGILLDFFASSNHLSQINEAKLSFLRGWQRVVEVAICECFQLNKGDEAEDLQLLHKKLFHQVMSYQ